MEGVNSPVIICCLIAIVVSLAITFIRGTNVGYIAFPLAFLIGGIGMGTSATTVISYFPISLFVQIVLMTVFFGYAIENGTLQLIANRVVYWFRGATALLPIVLFLISFVICAVGCAPQAIGAALAAIAFGVHKKTGLNYYVCVAAACWGGMTGGFCPTNGLFYTVIRNLLMNIGQLDAVSAASICHTLFWSQLAIQLISLGIVYFWFKAYKGADRSQIEDASGFEKPEPMNKTQKTTTIIVLACVAVAIIVPILKTIGIPLFVSMNNYITMASVSTIGAALCSILHLADDRKVVKERVPWSMLLMIAGMTALISVMTSAGLTEWIAGIFDNAGIPTILLPLLVCLLAGIVSIFSDATSVVIPLFIPICIAISSVTDCSLMLLITCAIIGTFTTGKSPMSTGGAMLVMFAPEDRYQHWFNFTLGYSLGLLLLFSVLSLILGLFPW